MMLLFFIISLGITDFIQISGQQLRKEPHCDCDWRLFQHYEAKRCRPVYEDKPEDVKPECACPTRFNCSEEDKGNANENACVYKEHVYPVGADIPLTNPCRRCSCRKNILTNASTIHCRNIECFNTYTPEGCQRVFKANHCCSTIKCPDKEEEESLKGPICEYKGKMYYEGEHIYPKEDHCLTCVCNSDWTGINSTSCWRQDCMLEMEDQLKQGCIPIYQEDGCCPIEYHCPDHSLEFDVDRSPSQEFEDHKDEMCQFEGQYYPIGHDLDIKHPTKCVTCACKTPPDLICIHHSCPGPPNDDYKNCRPVKRRNICCPDYICVIMEDSKQISRQQLRKEPYCDCDRRLFQHYEAKKCRPVYKDKPEDGKPECTCPTRFDCPERDNGNADKNACIYKEHIYPVGAVIPVANPCRACYCRLDILKNAAAIDCASVECFDTYTPEGCQRGYTANSCCSTIVCPDKEGEKSLIVPICEYKGKMYYKGENIYPEEDHCLTCVCNSDWTGINSTSCWRHDCMLEMEDELKQGCIPIYHEKGCCPIEYHCPKHSVRFNFNRRPRIMSKGHKDEMCQFDGRHYPIGYDLDIKHPTNCVTCTCNTPPDFTCIHRSCPGPPNDDYENCRPMENSNQCCHNYVCDNREDDLYDMILDDVLRKEEAVSIES